MFFCEECRIIRKWQRPATYPYHSRSMGPCEICHRHRENYDVPALFLKPVKTLEEKTLDKRIQEEYHRKANELIITYRSGKTNWVVTEDLLKVLVHKGKEVDWYSTYELRLKIQEGFRKANSRR